MDTKTSLFRNRIFLPGVVATVVLLTSLVVSVNLFQRYNIHRQQAVSLKNTEAFFKMKLQEDSGLLSGLVEFIARDAKLRDAWQEQNRDTLYENARGIFENINSKYHVTHFYFHDINSVCFLRVHKPSAYGDYINRFTMSQARQQEKCFSGIELGPFGTFTLRVVYPWRINDKLVGYIELGEEIQHITAELKKTMTREFVFLINKKFLNCEQWQQGLAMMGKTGNWDQFDTCVVIDRTLKDDLSAINTAIKKHCISQEQVIFKVSTDHDYLGGFVDLYDVAGTRVGSIVVLSDITAQLASGRLLLGVLIAVFVIFCVLGGLLFYLYVGRIDRKLAQSHDAMRDEIAQRKLAEQRQAELTLQAQMANIAKSEFLANVNHEIRTPMNGILGFGELLESTSLDEEQQDYVRTIISSSRVLLTIINNILDTSKIEAGKLVLKSVDFDLAGLAMEVCEIARPRIKDKKIELICSIADGANNWFRGDPVRLRQVLTNLLDNAVKFTSQGRIELAVKVVSQDPDQATLEISVQDTGIGIAQDKQQSVFDVFQQADGSTTRKYGGIGLGLAISGQIVRHMNSSLNLHSEEGKGSRFYFVISLPKGTQQKTGSLLVDTHKEHSVSVDQAKAQLQNRSLRVLLAEDDTINQKLIVKMLSLPDYKLDIAVNGKEAIEMVKNHNYDIIMMDMQMPVMDGIAATQAIRRMGINLPIIALTANALAQHRRACLDAGMNEYITKPVQSKDLYAAIQKLLPAENRPTETAKQTQAKETKDNTVENHLNAADTQPIDMETLLEVCGDEEIACEMAQAICEDMPKVMAELLSAIEARDRDNIRLYAHRLKGATATIGALGVSSQAAAIEELARDNNIDQAIALIKQFQSDVDTLLAFLGEVKWLETVKQSTNAA